MFSAPGENPLLVSCSLDMMARMVGLSLGFAHCPHAASSVRLIFRVSSQNLMSFLASTIPACSEPVLSKFACEEIHLTKFMNC